MGVARSNKMLRGIQVAALLRKETNLNIFDDFILKEKYYQEIPDANKILKMFYDAYMILILNFDDTKRQFVPNATRTRVNQKLFLYTVHVMMFCRACVGEGLHGVGVPVHGVDGVRLHQQ
jgi:hypothetical protein